jgi:hypothetical protein
VKFLLKFYLNTTFAISSVTLRPTTNCLANELKCPVLSDDSDFYIFDLKYGYISFQDVVFKCESFKNNPDDFYLRAKIYKLDNFQTKLASFAYRSHKINSDIVQLNIKKDLLPVFAVICGNDYIKQSTFNALFKEFDSTDFQFSLLKRTSNRGYIEQKNTLYFKFDFDNLDKCSTCLKKIVDNTIDDLIDNTINEYSFRNPSMANIYGKIIELRKVPDDDNYKQENELFDRLYTQIRDKPMMVIIKLLFETLLFKF